MWDSIVKGVLHIISPPKKGHALSPERWELWAKRLPKSAFIIWLANEIANDMISCASKTLTAEVLIEAVDHNPHWSQHSAEVFLEKYFYGFHPSFDPKFDRLVSIFRKIIKRKIRKQLVKK